MSDLAPSLARILAMLEEAKGQFVPGQAICKAVGIPMMNLSGFIAGIRRARPELLIVGKKGLGYQLVPPPARSAEAATTPPVAAPQPVAEFDPPRKPRSGGGRSYRQPKGAPPPTPMHVRMAASMAVLDLIPSKAAEILKVVALETGETTDETLLRLLSYGCEVHRDLISGGANPLSLRAPRTQEREASRHER